MTRAPQDKAPRADGLAPCQNASMADRGPGHGGRTARRGGKVLATLLMSMAVSACTAETSRQQSVTPGGEFSGGTDVQSAQNSSPASLPTLSSSAGPPPPKDKQAGSLESAHPQAGSTATTSAIAAVNSAQGALPSAFDTFQVTHTALPEGHPNPRLRHVVLITIDALRADHLSLYGYPLKTSPNLEIFAAQAVRFDNAWAHASETKLAMPPLMTGQFPSNPVWETIEPGTGLLARLASAGMSIRAVVSNRWLSPDRGYSEGAGLFRLLDYFYPPPAQPHKRTGTRMDGEQVVKSMQALPFDPHKRTFTWLHLMDVHNPYSPPPPLRGRFGPLEGTDRYVNGPASAAFTATDRAYMTARYDESILWTDQLLAPLLRALSAPERKKDTLVIITSDHGESLGEDQYLGHGTRLSRELLRVPLIIRMPQTSIPVSHSIDLPVGHFDLAPTILAALDIHPTAHPTNGIRGVSLLGLLGTQSPEGKGGLSSRVTHDWAGTRSIPAAVETLHSNQRLLGLYHGGTIHAWEFGKPPCPPSNPTPESGTILQKSGPCSSGTLNKAVATQTATPPPSQVELMEWIAQQRRPPSPLQEDNRSRLNALGYAGEVP